MAEPDLSEETFDIRAKKYYYEKADQYCGLVTISRWSKFMTDKRMIIFTVLDDDSKLSWTFLLDSSMKKWRKSKRLKIKIARSSIENLICVTAKLVVDVSESEQSATSLKHFRVVSQSSCNATLEEQSDPLLKSFQDLDMSQFFDVRPRLGSDIGVEMEDGSMLIFIKRDTLLPAERSRKFRTEESSVPLEIYQGNSGTTANNRYIRDLVLWFMSQALTRHSTLSLEVREDGTLLGRARECEHPENEKSFRSSNAEVISSSEPFDADNPRVDVNISSNTLTLRVGKKNTAVDHWKLCIIRVLDPKDINVFFIPAEVPMQRIQIQPGVLMPEENYTLIVKGLQDIDFQEHPGKTFKVVYNMKTRIPNPKTDVKSIDLIHEAFNKVAVQIPRSLPNVTYWEITVKKIRDSKKLLHSTAPERSFTTEKSRKPFRFPLSFQAGCTYKVKLIGFHDEGCICKVKAKQPKSARCTCKVRGSTDKNDLVFEGQAIFRAELTISEVETLYEKALDYIDQEAHAPCHWLYRNRPLEYFEEILANGGIMKVNEKDSSGDPASPINLKIKGLSFTATVRLGSTTGEPIPVSPFGNTRLLVHAQKLLHKAPNMYFADFYCRGSQLHHVMLVLTKPESEADRFCEKHILKLKINDNPFLFRVSSVNLQVSTSKNLFVHVFYTEDLDINRYTLKRDIKPAGTGNSISVGLPKNRFCGLCNLNQVLDHDVKNWF